MTGNEIKKALECCSGYEYCQNCPYCDVCGYPSEMIKQTIAYINQLEAEVERLKSLNKTQGVMVNELNKACKNMKSEAIKEFAERLKEETDLFTRSVTYDPSDFVLAVSVDDINNLVSEMEIVFNGGDCNSSNADKEKIKVKVERCCYDKKRIY